MDFKFAFFLSLIILFLTLGAVSSADIDGIALDDPSGLSDGSLLVDSCSKIISSDGDDFIDGSQQVLSYGDGDLEGHDSYVSVKDSNDKFSEDSVFDFWCCGY